MSAAKPTASLGAGLVAALALSACGAALLAALPSFVGNATALRAVVALLGFAYMLYTIGRSGERVGRLTTVACWVVVASGAWLMGLPLAGYVLVHIGLVWLVRSLYYYSGLLPALADLSRQRARRRVRRLGGAAIGQRMARAVVLFPRAGFSRTHSGIPDARRNARNAAGRRIQACASRCRERRAALVLVGSLNTSKRSSQT